MYSRCLFVISIILISFTNEISACKGCVNLDQWNFDKIVPRFRVVVVKFDVAFPYGDKHETFSKFAEETATNQDVLFGEIGVKDYGKKDNEALAKKYGVTKDDFPVVKIFKQDSQEPITFPKSTDFTLDNLRTFVRDNTDIYLGLPGCLETFDKLANEFIKAKEKDTILKKAESLAKDLKDNDLNSSKTYIIVMKKILENGKQFISQETDRVSKLLKEKISSKKQQELHHRLNILRAFAIPRKDEL